MSIKYFLIVNKQGQTRLSRYFEHVDLEERKTLEGEIGRRCLSRGPAQCLFMEYQNYKVVYRRYASLYVIMYAPGWRKERRGEGEKERGIECVLSVDGCASSVPVLQAL